jgi:putative membrane protein
MYYYSNFLPFSFFGPVLMVLFWVLVIYLIISLLRRTPHHYEGNNAVEILKERYARGEVTKEQFEVIKKDLQK